MDAELKAKLGAFAGTMQLKSGRGLPPSATHPQYFKEHRATWFRFTHYTLSCNTLNASTQIHIVFGGETQFFQPSESAGKNLMAAEKIKHPVIFGMI